MKSVRRANSAAARGRSAAAWLVLLLMLLPPVRRLTESSMTAQMLVQYPCMMLAGALLVADLPTRWVSGAQRWNELGIAGLVGSALALAVLMVPRVLDLALVDMRVEALKLLALAACGAALTLSWRPAGVVVQAFFLGNVLAMTAVVGILFQDSATRVCNSYGIGDQQTLGQALVWVASAIAASWLFCVALATRTRRGFCKRD
jgi:hypothetical protein